MKINFRDLLARVIILMIGLTIAHLGVTLFVLADLGVSSMQIDDPSRGFTFKQDGPLDLRLDPTAGTTAAQRLRELDEEELASLPRYLNGDVVVRRHLIDDPFYVAGVRDYTGHEPMNRIHWSATARENKMMVFHLEDATAVDIPMMGPGEDLLA